MPTTTRPTTLATLKNWWWSYNRNPGDLDHANPTSDPLGSHAFAAERHGRSEQGGNNPTGTITFTLVAPAVLGGGVVYTDVVTVHGNGTYDTTKGTNPGGYLLPTTGTVTGTYQWNATYSGDANNTSVGDVDKPSEQVYPVLPTCVVNTSSNPDFIGSLPWFINLANDSTDPQPFMICFDIPEPGPFVINLTSGLKSTHPVIIDGTSQPGFAGTPLIQIKGSNQQFAGLTLGAGSSGSTIEGLNFVNFAVAGIQIETDRNLVEGNYLGTNMNGTGAGPGNAVRLLVDGTAYNTIGGTTSAAGNLISDNITGVVISGSGASNASSNTVMNNRISGNTMGVVISGSGASNASSNTVMNNRISGNTTGVVISGSGASNASSNAVINNTISSYSEAGVSISGSGATGTLIQGNSIRAPTAGVLIPRVQNMMEFTLILHRTPSVAPCPAMAMSSRATK